ncbi:MAG: DALR domain-containing protein, partial [Cyanobacteria bacterium J06598_4]
MAISNITASPPAKLKSSSTATNSWSTLEEGLLFGANYGEQLGFSGSNAVDQELIDRFKSAVDDDFNFAGGLAVMFATVFLIEQCPCQLLLDELGYSLPY